MSPSTVAAEHAAVRETLNLSRQVAASFVAQLGALAPIIVPPIPLQAHIGRRPGFQATVLDDKYWFAKLYELITYYEIRDENSFEHPGFVLHFIPIFYQLYHSALTNFQRGHRAQVHPLWRAHFDGLQPPAPQGSMDGAKHSVRTGVTAHVQGDMATALERAYRTWDPVNRPPFDALKRDFFEKNRRTFEEAKAAFFLDLNDKGPFPFRADVGQLVIASGERAVGGGLAVDEVYRWREAAWQEAASRLKAR